MILKNQDNMRKVITSFGIGNHRRFLSLSIPTFYLYAQNHQYDIFLPNESFFSENIKILPPSWWKIEIIQYLLEKYEQVLWLDADVVICQFEHDISDSLDKNTDFGVVVHETNDGSVPNCGVWLLNRNCLNWLDSLKSFSNFRRSQCWWEQAALLHILGINPDDQKIILPETYPIPWTKLDYIWNPHINDHRKIPPDTRFFHATCFSDRYSAMQSIIQQMKF